MVLRVTSPTVTRNMNAEVDSWLVRPETRASGTIGQRTPSILGDENNLLGSKVLSRRGTLAIGAPSWQCLGK